MNYLLLIRAILIIALINPIRLNGQCNDFVTVDGKKLKCGQNDFFALATNYVVEVMHNCGTDGAAPHTIQYHYPSRAHMYSPDNAFSPEINNRTEAYNAIVKDFTDMKNLGFNTVRVVNVGYQDIASKNCNVSVQQSIRYSDPAFNQLLLDIHADIIKAASQAGIKVVMLLGEIKFVAPYPWYKDGSRNNPQPTPPLAQTNGYINYLKLFSAKFNNDPTLLGIDFVNEPDLYNFESKTDLCQLTKTWNDAVKSKSNILTTIGLWSNSSVSWDANMLNIDFASYHNYPYVVDSVNLSDLPAAINRIKSDYWWFKNNIKIPWMVGETGLAAHPKNVTHPINATGNWSPWHTSGTLNDQADYLIGTLNASRDCGGSGYTWWTFMDEHVSVGQPNGPPPYSVPSAGPFWGLAYANEGNTPINWKQGAAAYIPGFSATSPSTPTQPANYYNYFNTPNTGKYAHGYVFTDGNVPIKDALIEIFDVNNKLYNTYTDANGHYIVYANANVAVLKVNATECNQYIATTGSSGIAVWYNDIQLTKIDRPISGNLNYANDLANSISVNDYANTYATFSNYQIVGSNFHVTAFSYIKLSPGTSVYPNNDFSATIGNFYHDCGTIVNSSNVAFRQNTMNDSTELTKSGASAKQILSTENEDINKSKELIVYPSPSNGSFLVKTNDVIEKELIVTDNLGHVVYSTRFVPKEIELNLDLASGIYTIEVTSKRGRAQQKIVIQN